MAAIFAVVPVKPFAEGKSRLAGILPDRERMALNRRLFERTLDVTVDFPGAAFTIVVSRCAEVLAAAAARGAQALWESEPDLNAAVALGTDAAMGLGAEGVLILPTDLPFATARLLRERLLSCHEPVLMLAPDRRAEGTNLLFQHPVALRRYHYGSRSFEAHARAGAMLGVPVLAWRDDDLGFDLDGPEDYANYLRRSTPQAAAADAISASGP